jgi:hypothetical protein
MQTILGFGLFFFVLLAAGASFPAIVAFARGVPHAPAIAALAVFSWLLVLIPFVGWFLSLAPWWGALIWALVEKPKARPGAVCPSR